LPGNSVERNVGHGAVMFPCPDSPALRVPQYRGDMKRHALVWVLVLVAVGGCGTRYVPRSNGQISHVTSGLFGTPKFALNGRVYPKFNDLREVLAVDPAAAASVRRADDMEMWAIVTGFIGIITLVGGGVHTAVVGDGWRTPAATAWLLGSGISFSLSGSFLVRMTSAEWDAVNQYNDAMRGLKK
jgi:hypothetical protein